MSITGSRDLFSDYNIAGLTNTVYKINYKIKSSVSNKATISSDLDKWDVEVNIPKAAFLNVGFLILSSIKIQITYKYNRLP